VTRLAVQKFECGRWRTLYFVATREEGEGEIAYKAQADAEDFPGRPANRRPQYRVEEVADGPELAKTAVQTPSKIGRAP
jgi:hypothetical protein